MLPPLSKLVRRLLALSIRVHSFAGFRCESAFAQRTFKGHQPEKETWRLLWCIVLLPLMPYGRRCFHGEHLLEEEAAAAAETADNGCKQTAAIACLSHSSPPSCWSLSLVWSLRIMLKLQIIVLILLLLDWEYTGCKDRGRRARICLQIFR